MIEIICQGNSSSEARLKCMVAEILLTEEKVPTVMAINVLNAISGVHIATVRDNE